MNSFSTVLLMLVALPAALAFYGPLNYSIGLSDDAKLYIMCMHNDYRSQLAKGSFACPKPQPKAANMQAMCWCEELVAKAQAHASHCGGPPHDNRTARFTEHFPDVGQNLMQCMKSSPLDEAMQAFAEECAGYDYDTNYCDTANAGRAHVCGHYTALMWAETKCLGCAYDACPGFPNGRLVCNYGPGGNKQGEKPYVKGEPCTQCADGQMCLDGGLCIDSSSCGSGSCTASQSTGSTCVDKDPNCPAYKTYPTIKACESTSPYLMYSQTNCRATCNWCGGVDPNQVCSKSMNVTLCQSITTIDNRECRVGNGLKYAGTKSVTKNDVACIPWSTNDARTNYYHDFEFPDRNKTVAQNYCRNPASSGTEPWCYTATSWGYCDVPNCP